MNQVAYYFLIETFKTAYHIHTGNPEGYVYYSLIYPIELLLSSVLVDLLLVEIRKYFVSSLLSPSSFLNYFYETLFVFIIVIGYCLLLLPIVIASFPCTLVLFLLCTTKAHPVQYVPNAMLVISKRKLKVFQIFQSTGGETTHPVSADIDHQPSRTFDFETQS